MLKDKIRDYRNKEIKLNCAETMLYSANEEYQMNLSQDTFKTMVPFGGGMAIENVCGAITGSLAVLGILFTEKSEGEKNKEGIKRITKEFFKKFEEKLSIINCKELKEMYRDEEKGCEKIIYVAGEILDEIVTKDLIKN